jgi:hypothetical protein
MFSKPKRTPTQWEKILACYITRKYRELKKLNTPQINEQIKK